MRRAGPWPWWLGQRRSGKRALGRPPTEAQRDRAEGTEFTGEKIFILFSELCVLSPVTLRLCVGASCSIVRWRVEHSLP